MVSHKAIVVELASSLEPGTTIRELCPRCNGGSTNELSLSITTTEDSHVLWQCHRSSCTEKGRTDGVQGPDSVIRAAKRRSVFFGKTVDLSPEHLARINELWGITDPKHWWWTDEHMGRVCMSIRSPKYVHRGWVLRDIYDRSRVKALTYVDEGEEGISWYKGHLNAPTVVVEDIPSAYRAGQYVNSVALCGTGLGISRAEEIAEYATRPIVIALDQDATAEAFRIAHRWALLWGDVKVLPLQQDIKNMKEKDIESRLRNI